jgi:hypothetical protein
VVRVAVYVAEAASALVGVSVAVLPLTLYEAGSSVPPAFFNVNVEELTVPGLRALLKVALTVVPKATPVTPLAGVVELTLSGVGPEVVMKTTSTQ